MGKDSNMIYKTSLFDTLGLIDTGNRFDYLSVPDSPVQTYLDPPTSALSPVTYDWFVARSFITVIN